MVRENGNTAALTNLNRNLKLRDVFSRNHPLLTFVLISYLFSWTFWLLSSHVAGSIWFKVAAFSLEIPKTALMTALGDLGPGIAAIIVIADIAGINGLRTFLTKLRPDNWGWVGLAIVAPPALMISELLFTGLTLPELTGAGSWGRWLRLLAVNLPLAPLWEELGWRGYLLPRLQSSMTSLAAGTVVGVAWGLWHTPLYIAVRIHNSSFGVFPLCFFFLALALSVLFTWVYNVTNASLSVLVLLHASWNSSTILFLAWAMAREGMKPFFVVTVATWVIALGLILFVGPDLSRRRNETSLEIN